MCSVQCAVCNLRCAVCGVLYAVFSLHCVQCTVSNVKYSVSITIYRNVDIILNKILSFTKPCDDWSEEQAFCTLYKLTKIELHWSDALKT